jgi:hypothetical protein
MRELLIIDITEISVICIFTQYPEKHLYLDRSYFPAEVSIGCKLIHIEHGYCDLYDENNMLAAFINFRHAMKSFEEKYSTKQ